MYIELVLNSPSCQLEYVVTISKRIGSQTVLELERKYTELEFK